jgi:hypothetical protein
MSSTSSPAGRRPDEASAVLPTAGPAAAAISPQAQLRSNATTIAVALLFGAIIAGAIVVLIRQARTRSIHAGGEERPGPS